MTDQNRIEKIIKDVLVDILSSVIVETIHQRNMAKKPKALVIFSEGTLGFDDALKALTALEEAGCTLEIVLTYEAQQFLTAEAQKRLNNFERVHLEGSYAYVYKLIEQTDLLILPNLTVNSTSKIANCISDTYLSKAASNFIMQGKRVIAARNNCCPKDVERVNGQKQTLNDFYGQQMMKHMTMLEQYGVTFTNAKNMNRKVLNIKSAKRPTKESVHYVEKRLVTYSDVVTYPDHCMLYIKDHCMMTDLAKESLKRKNIKINKH